MRRVCNLVTLTVALVACSGGSSSTGSVSNALTGPIEVRLADGDNDDSSQPPAVQATHIVVTIARIDARVDDVTAKGDDDDWTTLSVGKVTVDLLALPTGGFASLGIAQLPAGGIEQLRLFVSSDGPNYVSTADGQTHPLLVPSGEIRVNGDFDAEACASGFVTLAFAGRRSIEVHPLDNVESTDAGAGDGGSPGGAATPWVLRPVIWVREAVVSGAPCSEEDETEKDHGHKG